MVATYVLAPLPNWICSRCSNPDDFMESAGNSIIDFGRFLTGFLVFTGIGELFAYACCSFFFWVWATALQDLFHFSTSLHGPFFSLEDNVLTNGISLRSILALPAVLAHTGTIEIPAMIMSIIGGLLIYGTIISFSMFFREQEEF